MSPSNWLNQMQAYWWIIGLIFMAGIGVYAFNARLDAHETLVIRHVEREREVIGLLRKICRKLPGDQEVCNAREDDFVY